MTAAFLVILICLLGYASVYSAVDCLTITTNSSEGDKNYCKNELAKIEAELAALLKQQEAQKKQSGTIQGDINYLTSQINALKAKIKARSLAIAQLSVSIKEKVAKIETLEQKIVREHESLAALLRNTNEYDDATLLHLVLSGGSVSEFYGDLESYSTLKESIQRSVDDLRGVRTLTEAEKKELQLKQNAETDARAELEGAQRKVTLSETEKKQLLAVSKQKEAEYQKLAAEKAARAARIRSALFPLANANQKIEFGTALQYANEVKAKFGVDPAFLLAILTQESNLGANVGQCYLTNPTTGAGAGKNTGTPFPNVMKPGRDVEPFLAITEKLGLDPFTTAVSCPIAGVAGWGGAMGPAQFIPSTWKIFESRLTSVLGHAPNPWAPRDAFFASGMYLSDLGAIGTSQASQNQAACRYYGSGGASCGYSASVQRIKIGIQANIDLLED